MKVGFIFVILIRIYQFSFYLSKSFDLGYNVFEKVYLFCIWNIFIRIETISDEHNAIKLFISL